tara:strand:- start:184 stop:372 length:189 start_codon:yes stop_codon:yes gene_type:complete
MEARVTLSLRRRDTLDSRDHARALKPRVGEPRTPLGAAADAARAGDARARAHGAETAADIAM